MQRVLLGNMIAKESMKETWNLNFPPHIFEMLKIMKREQTLGLRLQYSLLAASPLEYIDRQTS